MNRINTPLDSRRLSDLVAGDEVYLTGYIYTARDQAHKRLSETWLSGGEIPLDLKNSVIFYCGPTPAGKRVIGSCGPTTSSRMDGFTPDILALGVKGLIGKGRRSAAVREAVKDNGAVYFVAPAGAGAFLSQRVREAEVAAYDDLGPEAIYRFYVEEFPLIVAIDPAGNSIYEDI